MTEEDQTTPGSDYNAELTLDLARHNIEARVIPNHRSPQVHNSASTTIVYQYRGRQECRKLKPRSQEIEPREASAKTMKMMMMLMMRTPLDLRGVLIATSSLSRLNLLLHYLSIFDLFLKFHY